MGSIKHLCTCLAFSKCGTCVHCHLAPALLGENFEAGNGTEETPYPLLLRHLTDEEPEAPCLVAEMAPAPDLAGPAMKQEVVAAEDVVPAKCESPKVAEYQDWEVEHFVSMLKRMREESLESVPGANASSSSWLAAPVAAMEEEGVVEPALIAGEAQLAPEPLMEQHAPEMELQEAQASSRMEVDRKQQPNQTPPPRPPAMSMEDRRAAIVSCGNSRYA